MKHRGVAYYPEAWPPERWNDDIRLMRDAHINLVRMGEFAWARFEPRDGEFSLDWWRDICGRMRDSGINILACTPSAAPPAWLTKKHPDILPVDEFCRAATHGGRRHYCPSSAVYAEYVERVNRKLAAAAKDNEAVIAWQIDNEIAVAPCFCPRCAAAFRAWLRRRYGTLDELNKAWGNEFWSGDFSSWDEIVPPRHRVSWKLDYRRFQDDAFAEFISRQAETLREARPGWRITTNQWAGLNPAADSIKYFENLDVASYDGYWDYYASREFYSSVWDFYRNVKSRPRPFWLVETNAWNPASAREGGLRALRPWAYEAFAKGSEAHVFFRWRQSRMGEEDHPAILDWSGRPGRAYEAVRNLFREMDDIAPRLKGLPLPQCGVAILFDYDSALCGELENRDYRDHLVRINALLGRMAVQSDILPVRGSMNIAGYRLLVLPQLEMVDPWLADRLKEFVRMGGCILALTRLATLDRNGKYTTNPMPDNMTDLFGLTVAERCPIHDESPKMMKLFPGDSPGNDPSVKIGLNLKSGRCEGRGVQYMEMLEPAPGTAGIGVYESGAFKGGAAATQNEYGEGFAFYQGCRLDMRSSHLLLRHVIEKSGAGVPVETPRYVEILKRGNLRFYLNHGAEPAVVSRMRPGEVIIGDADAEQVRLDAFDVCIIEEP